MTIYRISFSLILFSISIIFSAVVESNAGIPSTNQLGCCIDSNGFCSGGCENSESDCSTTIHNSCDGSEFDLGDLTMCDGTNDLNDCFVLGGACVQSGDSKGTCIFPTSGDDCSAPSVIENCDIEGGVEITDENCFTYGCALSSCVETPLQDQPAGCTENNEAPNVIVPTLNQWGIIIASVLLGCFAVIALWRSRDVEI